MRIEANDRAGLERLLRYCARIYEVFPLVCPQCGGGMRIIACITKGAAIRKILGHLGEPTSPPRLLPARGPSLCEMPGAETARDTLGQRD